MYVSLAQEIGNLLKIYRGSNSQIDHKPGKTGSNTLKHAWGTEQGRMKKEQGKINRKERGIKREREKEEKVVRKKSKGKEKR